MEPPPLEATIRRCLYRDLDHILPIYNYYVSRTIVSLHQDTQPLAYMRDLYNSVLDQDLPFLVVTLGNTEVLGYAYAHNFRRLPAFGGSVEIFIYLDPDATGRGIGKNMLTVLMGMLRSVRRGTGPEHGIREVLAIVPVDEGRDASGFFLKANFEDRGSLKGVGWKMGRWIDMKFLQRSLHEEPRDQEQTVHTARELTRQWWSSLFRRRRRPPAS